MKRFVIILAGLVLLAVTSSSFAIAIKWDNESGDNLWRTALNWDLNRVPSIAAEDRANLVLTDPCGCIIDSTHTDANAAETKRLRVGYLGAAGDLRMTGGLLTVLTYAKVGEKGLGRFWMDGGTATVGSLYIAQQPVANGSFMTMTAGSLTTTGGGPIKIGNGGGTGTLNMYGGTIDVKKYMNVGNSDGGIGTLNMYGGAMHIIGSTLRFGANYGTGTLNMQGGTIEVGTSDNRKGMQIGNNNGTGDVNMVGGTIYVSENLQIATGSGTTGHLQLDGGTIWAQELLMGRVDTVDPCGTMDIKAGTLIIDGDETDLIAGYINDPNGWITADDGTGNVIMDYDIRNPGKTTLTATSGDANLPRLTINVEPNDINTYSIVPPIDDPIYFWQDQPISIGTGPSKNCPYVYRFHHWEGDVADPNSPSTTVFMDQHKTVTAVFLKDDERICGDECHPILLGDLNADCYIDLTDFSIYASEWLSCTHPDCDEL